MRRIALVTVLLGLCAAVGARAEPPIGLAARVERSGSGGPILSYPVLDPSGVEVAAASWRIVGGQTSFENYLAATPEGRLYDFGGTFLRWTDDDGATWTQVRPIERQLSGEGAVVLAPNGDVLGVGWDPYTGDHLLSYHRDAEDGLWRYMEVPLHQPFYDRPWLALVPGPITVAGSTYPYAAFLRSGFWGEPLLVSLDGLNYAAVSSTSYSTVITDPADLVLSTDPWTDWLQPQAQARIAPLPGGGALAPQAGVLSTCPWRTLVDDLRWACLHDESVPPEVDRLVADSLGRLHAVWITEEHVEYGISLDGGRTWAWADLFLPYGLEVGTWDVKASGALGLTAIAVHGTGSTGDRDVVFKVATGTGTPEPLGAWLLGDGDQRFGVGVTSTLPRFDFQSVAILPDGRVAATFGDAEHPMPVLAIEVPGP